MSTRVKPVRTSEGFRACFALSAFLLRHGDDLSFPESLALELRLGMNWKLLISALLMMVLLPAGALGLACDVRCGLEATAGDGSHIGAAASGNSTMPMHCHSMQPVHHAGSSQNSASCEWTGQACGQDRCASSASWLAGQESSSGQAAHATLSPLDAAMPAFAASAAISLSPAPSSPPPVHRPLAVLRI
jgi:hypothetical protein